MCLSISASVSTISAPGKALIAGGYVVLDPNNVGLTVAVGSRFYCSVKVKVWPSFVSLIDFCLLM